jgi:hypothetical protein
MYFRGNAREGVHWTAEALSQDISERTRAALENERAALLFISRGPVDKVLALARSSLDRFRRLGDDAGLVYALTTLANVVQHPALWTKRAPRQPTRRRGRLSHAGRPAARSGRGER